MGWLGLLKGLISLASRAAKLINDKRLMDAGEQRGISKGLAEIAVSAGISRAEWDEAGRLTIGEVNAELEKDFRD